MLVYNKFTGLILYEIPDDQPMDGVFYHHPPELRDSLAFTNIENHPRNLKNYRIIDDKLVRKSDQEIGDIMEYGKILTEEERLNVLLFPTQQEIQKAETTIEILSLLQEVNAI